MISDSTYEIEAVVLTPWGGILAGVVGAAAMLIVVVFVQQLSGWSLADVLVNVGGVLRPTSLHDRHMLVLALGAGLHSMLGALFGLLYAVCQQQATRRAMIGTGMFYGFFLWLVGRLLIGIWLGEPLRAMIGTWFWLLACLVYGLCLSIAAIWQESQRPLRDRIVVPKD
jgi:hypothetical protein